MKIWFADSERRLKITEQKRLFVTEFSTTKRFIDPDDEKKMAAASNLVKAKKFKKKLDVSIMCMVNDPGIHCFICFYYENNIYENI